MEQPFGDWAKELRTSRKIKQGDLAQTMQIDQSVVSQIEADKRPPTADFCIAFAAAMGLSVEYVLAKAGKPGYEQHLNSGEGQAVQGANESQAARKIRALVLSSSQTNGAVTFDSQ